MIENKPIEPMSNDRREQFKKELLFVMWRWANESEITMGEWLEVCHEAIETVLTPKPK